MAGQEELAKAEVIEQVKSAFAPNYCAVQAEFRASMWCEVFDKNKSGRSERFMIDELGDYQTRATLRETLQHWREILGNDGYEFD
jgi:hypothetical protein